MRLLAVDPALRNTGFAILDNDNGEYSAVTYGVISNAPKLPQSKCLAFTREKLNEVIEQYGPTVCAIESIIYVQSYKTAITMGAARGAALIAAAENGMPVFEYAPRRVKQAVVGRGGADKAQVAFMMRALLSLKETPQSDAADALAIGMAHFYATDPNKPGVLTDRKEI